MRFTNAHKVIPIVTLCALFSFSCAQPTDAEPPVDNEQAVTVDDPVDNQPIQPEPEEPQGFQPAAHTVYILDGEDWIYLKETTDDPDLFRAKCSAWEGAVESYNRKRNKPGPYPYRFVAGEAP